jgi:LuxR family maltose regulon positive regulatory protein
MLGHPAAGFGERDASRLGKEKRTRGGVYWIAYRQMQGKLRKKYIGALAAMTIARLEEVAGDMEGSF